MAERGQNEAGKEDWTPPVLGLERPTKDEDGAVALPASSQYLPDPQTTGAMSSKTFWDHQVLSSHETSGEIGA